MKKLLALILALLMVMTFIVACDEEESSSSTSTNSSQDPTSSSTDDSSSSKEDDNKNEISASIPRVDYNVNVNQSFGSSTFDISSFGNTDLAEAYSNAVSKDVTAGVKITTPGIYRIYGSSTKNGIEIDITRNDKTAPLQEVILVLDGAQIQNTADASIPPIYSKGCDLRIILLKDKRNIIFDNRVVNEQTSSEKGAVYVKTGNLTIEGEGELKIETKYKNAIYCTKSITIDGGVFNLTANYNGIYAAGDKKSMETDLSFIGGLTINSGDFTIDAKRAALKTGDYDADTTPVTDVKAKLILNGGKFQLKSGQNAIDAYGEIIVNGGGYNIEAGSDGVNATENVTFATDNNTVMVINSKDTGIKADKSVIFGGKTNVKVVSENDAVEAYDIVVDTTGVIYLVTNPGFEEDMDYGEYIRDENKQYHKVDRELFPKAVFYATKNSAKGLDAENTIEIKNGIIAIDTVEDCIVTTDSKDLDNELAKQTQNTITITGGILVLDSCESAIKADEKITVSGASTEIEVYRSDKGINADEVTIADAKVALIAVSDAIDADDVTVSSGTVYLFDKVDIPSTGSFVVNGGTVVCISTTNSPKTPTTSAGKVIAASIQSPADYVYGNCINIKGTGIDVTLQIPKSYAEKLSVVVVTDDIEAGEYTISVGTYAGSPTFFEYSGGTFTAKSSQKVTVE